ncbi:MFS transporter [Mammaliicoccus sciuri]|uniref:MFS transporter n=1 Tax=Mammaliicoccus sciuri TaxID=1296 RepID=UPI000BDD5B35|nr:MFS transporter [Mammaliicoccus sciuri]PCQ20673.1 hypothetical protein CP995_07140 [Klebsiella pneumoniae]PTJ91853.1 hypothetical protein BU010_13135 [Mammaliicoccus sciuri]
MKILEECGKNLLKQNKLFPIFLLTIFTKLSATLLLLVMSIELYKFDSSGERSSLINVLFLIGVSLVGLFGGTLLNKYKGAKISIISSILTIVSTLLFIVLKDYSIYSFYVFTFLIALSNGFDLPNSNATLPLINNDKESLNKQFSLYQTLEQTFNIVLPLLIVIILKIASFDLIYALCLVLNIIGLVPWFIFDKILPKNVQSKGNNKFSDVFTGYKIVLNNINLLLLNINRLFVSLIFTIIAVALPFFIGYLAKGDIQHASFLRNYFASISGILFTVLGIIFTIYFMKNQYTIKIMAYCTSLIGISGYLIFYIFKSDISLFILAACIGIGQYFGRISMISLGQRLTPTDDLAVTILAGDTITRIFSMFVNVLAIFLLSNFKDNIFDITLIFVILGIGSIFTIYIPVKNYEKMVVSNEYI